MVALFVKKPAVIKILFLPEHKQNNNRDRHKKHEITSKTIFIFKTDSRNPGNRFEVTKTQATYQQPLPDKPFSLCCIPVPACFLMTGHA
jgi:hypothetical protein